MKTFISRWLLLAAGILCLNCNTPAVAQVGDKERIETIQKALKTVTEKSKPDTIKAKFDEALQLINLATGTVPEDDRFEYAQKSFVFKDDGPGKESSYIRYKKAKVVIFDPKAKGKKK